MEQTQLEHLKEATKDVRTHFNSAYELMHSLNREADDHEYIPRMHRQMQDMERALTRIEMALREIK